MMEYSGSLPRIQPMAPGYAMGGAQKPVQRPMVRPDALRPPQGGPGTAAPPILAPKAPMPGIRPFNPAMGGVTPAIPRPMQPVGYNRPNIAPMAPPPNVNVAPPPAAGPQVLPRIQPPAPAGPAGSPFGDKPGVRLGDVGSLIQQYLSNSSRFDLPAFKDSYNFAKGDLEQEANKSTQSAIADAARRGVFHSDIPDTMTGGLNDIKERFNRGLGSLASNLSLQQAQTGSQDFNTALSNAFRYMENQQGADQFAAQLGLNSANAGFQGSPDIAQLLAQISGQPLPQAPGNSLGDLGSLLPLLRQPQGTTKYA